ncbi:unnamed protein product [Rotaria sp. Silwood2]|nr:unnamed protein product [Rotaria sp. Silwood2]CAF4255813.1 unnamed protein product [Rotaria sp. Silwood2]
MIWYFRILILISITFILTNSKWIKHQEGEGDEDGHGNRVDRAAAVVEVLGGFGGTNNNLLLEKIFIHIIYIYMKDKEYWDQTCDYLSIDNSSLGIKILHENNLHMYIFIYLQLIDINYEAMQRYSYLIDFFQNLDKGKINGVPIAPIVGGAVGGVISIAILVGFCVCFFTCILPCMKGRPLCFPKFYIHGAIPMGSDISDSIFISGTFASYHYISGEYYGPYDIGLGFYPEADHIVHGKGKDDIGIYVITGIYSRKTLRMSLKLHYQLGTGNPEENLGHTAIVQVKWNRSNEQFEGKYYVRNTLHHDENKFVIRYEGA